MSKLLVISEGNRKGRKVELDLPQIHIGRDPVCELTLEDGMASRKHAVITNTDTGVRIQDLQSRNGTRVNGATISTCNLEHGDVINIGNTRITYKLKELEVSSDEYTPIEDSNLEHIKTIAISTQDLFIPGESARDIESPGRAAAALKTIYEASQIINSVLDTEELLNRVIDLVFQSLDGVAHCFIFLMNDDTGQLEYKTGRGLHGHEDELHQYFSAPIVGSVLEKKQALLTYNAQTNEHPASGQDADDKKIHSAICAPLQTRDKILGIIQANTLDPNHMLTEEDLRLLASIGLHAGSALENSNLYEALKDEKRALQNTHEALKRTQKQLMQHERMAAVGDLAAGVVHDIITPLAVIQGYHKLMDQELESKAGAETDLGKLKKCTAGMAEGIERSSEVIQSLIDFAKPEKGSREEHDINLLLEETLVFLQSQISGSNTQIVRDLEEPLPPILCDGKQIKRVLVNIIMNALQAMDPRGTLGLSSGLVIKQGQTYIAMQIQDNGPGIPEEVIQQIFDPFFSTKTSGPAMAGGSGLGLSICYNILKSHEGTIEVDSEPGTGSVFTLYLPASEISSSGALDRTMKISLEE